MLTLNTEGQVRHLRLNRPEKRNALSFELCRELTAALDGADQDPAIHAILLTAEPPAFCAGMDLKEVGVVPESEVSLVHDALFTAGARVATPIVAAVNGAAIAGGTGLVANAHMVVAHPDAKFGLTEIKIGLWPLLVFRAMVQAIGQRRALEWSLTGRTITAEEAQRAGLVSEIHPNPDEQAGEIAQTIACYSRQAVRCGFDYTRGEQSGERARQLRAELLTGRSLPYSPQTSR